MDELVGLDIHIFPVCEGDLLKLLIRTCGPWGIDTATKENRNLISDTATTENKTETS